MKLEKAKSAQLNANINNTKMRMTERLKPDKEVTFDKTPVKTNLNKVYYTDEEMEAEIQSEIH